MKLRYVILATLLAPLLTHADKDNGVSLFEQHCASCHGQQTDDRIPTRANLSFMNPLALLAAMETGSMRVQASALNANEKRALAEGVTGKELADLTMPQQAFCEADHAPVDQHSTVHWSGWGGDKQGSGHARQPIAGLTRQDLANLRLAWAFAFPGASQARSQPAVLDDVVYVGGAEGSVTALDAFTGCIYWRVDTTSAMRGAMVVAKIGERYAVLAVARSTEVYAIDAATGKILWRTKAGFHPLHSVTGTPALHNGRLFIPISSVEVGVARMPSHTCCTSSGGVVALALKTGEMFGRCALPCARRKKSVSAQANPCLHRPAHRSGRVQQLMPSATTLRRKWRELLTPSDLDQRRDSGLGHGYRRAGLVLPGHAG